MTLPSASWPNERPPDRRGEGDAADGDTPPAGAVSLADLIADSGPLPADAALECVQRIAERLTTTARSSGADLEPANVLVDDDGGVWIRKRNETARPDLDCDASPAVNMNRLGRLLAFVATGDGAHLADGAEVDPAILPPPLSAVASRLFSRNGACYRSYADLARDAADLRLFSSDAAVQHDAASRGLVEQPFVPNASSPTIAVADETPSDAAASAERSPPETSNTFIIAMLIVFLFGAGVAFVLWRIL